MTLVADRGGESQFLLRFTARLSMETAVFLHPYGKITRIQSRRSDLA